MSMLWTLLPHPMCSELHSIYPSCHQQTFRSVLCPCCFVSSPPTFSLACDVSCLQYFLQSATTMKTDHLLPSEFFIQPLSPLLWPDGQPFLQFYLLSGPLTGSFSGAGHLAADMMSSSLLLSQFTNTTCSREDQRFYTLHSLPQQAMSSLSMTKTIETPILHSYWLSRTYFHFSSQLPSLSPHPYGDSLKTWPPVFCPLFIKVCPFENPRGS